MPADPVRATNRDISALFRVLALLGVATFVLAAIPVTAGAAQDVSDRAGTPHMVIEEIRGVLTAADRLTIAGQLQGGEAPVTDVRVLVTVHQRTDERWRYQQAVDERVVGNVLHSFAADFRVLEADSSTAVNLTQGVDELGVTIPDSQPGVYPIRVQVLVGGEVVDEQMTSIVLVPERDLVPLAFGLLVPVQQRPPYDGQGNVADPEFLAALEADGNIGTLANDLRRAENLPLTLAVDGLTVRVLQSMAEGFTDATGDTAEARGSEAPHARQADAAFHTLRGAAGHDHVEVTAKPYASADLVALTRGGLGAEAQRQVTEGRSLAASALNSQVHPDVLVPTDGLNDETFREVARTGVDTLVLDEVYLQSGDPGNISPAAVRRADDFTALVPDPWLAEAAHRWEDQSPAMAAQRLVGELATIHLERPSTADRGVLMSAASSSGKVLGGLLPAIAQQVSDASFLEPATLTELADTTPAEQPTALAYPGEHRTAELPADYTEHLASTRAQLGALAGTLVADPITPSRFDRLVLQAASTHYRGTHLDAGRELLSAIDQAVATTSASVSILDSEPITLTATEDEIPVAVSSDADIPLQVQVSVIGSRFQVMDAPDRTITLQPNDTALLSYRVRATSAGGTSPIRLVVTDPDGVHTIATGNIVVRSAAASPVALTVASGALLFLSVWWIRDVRKRRRPAPVGPSSAPTPAN